MPCLEASFAFHKGAEPFLNSKLMIFSILSKQLEKSANERRYFQKMELDRNKNSNSTMPHCDFLAVERKTSYSLEVHSSLAAIYIGSL